MPIKATRLVHKLPELRAGMHAKAAAVVSKTAHDIEADAKQRAPEDTGALKSSIQTTMDGDLSATVSVGVEYGIFQEFGTYKMAAKPYMTPAAEAARQPFIEAMRKVATG